MGDGSLSQLVHRISSCNREKLEAFQQRQFTASSPLRTGNFPLLLTAPPSATPPFSSSTFPSSSNFSSSPVDRSV